MQKNRNALLRGVTAGILWFLILGCFYTSARTLGKVSNAVDYIEGKALTPQASATRQLAAETARAYAVEWGTFDGADGEEYEQRLRRFAGEDYTFTPPQGVQRVTSASVLSVNEDDSLYRVKIALHVTRAVNFDASEAVSVSAVRKIPGMKINEDTSSENDESTVYWKDYINTVEVSLRVKDGKTIIIGSPVLSPMPAGKGEKPGQDMNMDEVPKDFETFVIQALDMYYKGKDMANFIVPGSEINTLGGYTLDTAAVSVFEQSKDDAKAIVDVEISTNGAAKIRQTVAIEAVKGDRWMLKRLGGW